MKWMTRPRPKIDRVACPWLIARYIDPAAEFQFVAADRIVEEAARTGAQVFDVPGSRFYHQGELCTFDVLLREYEVRAAGLDRLAQIVRGADTGRLELAPEAAGLLAVSVGLGRVIDDDQRLLAVGMHIYDALLAWCAVPGSGPFDP
jgi:hypothetical protein